MAIFAHGLRVWVTFLLAPQGRKPTPSNAPRSLWGGLGGLGSSLHHRTASALWGNPSNPGTCSVVWPERSKPPPGLVACVSSQKPTQVPDFCRKSAKFEGRRRIALWSRCGHCLVSFWW